MARIKTWMAPAYLSLCLLLGGSAQGIWGTMALQMLGLFIIVWAALDTSSKAGLPKARPLGWMLIALIVIIAVQLIPLPFYIWRDLPGREILSNGFQTLEIAPTAMPLSLSPYDALATLPAFIPPLAMLIATVRFGAPPSRILAITLIGITCVAIMIGILQTTNADPRASVYFYPISNFGSAIGFFANSNHMATMLLVAIPMIVALGATVSDKRSEFRRRITVWVITAGGVGVVVVGLALNWSLAGYGMVLPVTFISITTMLIETTKARWRLSMAFAVLSVLVILAVVATPLGERLKSQLGGSSLSSREEISQTTLKAAHEFGALGTGLGTFSKIYPLFESAASVDRTFVNHAHNDYLELYLELGVPGALLILFFLFWWGTRAREVITLASADHFATAATIASGTVLLHSTVDYPLRTAAIAAIFAMCLGFMLASRRTVSGESDLRPTRHLIIE